jgi:hypothetical protein
MLTTTVAVGGLVGVSSAATTADDDSLASKIATKFNINKDEVQTLIKADREEKHAERQAEHQKRFEERLSQLVKDGKITEEQKTKILEYHKTRQAALEAAKESFKDKTDEERKAAMDKQREADKKWAADNGIEEQYLMPGGEGRGPGGHRGGPRQ